MQLSKQLSEKSSLVNTLSQENLNLEDNKDLQTFSTQNKPTTTEYWKEGWESQIAALKVELAQLRFENESLSLQVKNLQNLPKKTTLSREESIQSPTSTVNETLQGSENMSLGSSSRNKKKSIKKKLKNYFEAGKNSMESNWSEETVSTEISVDVLRVMEQQQSNGVQGTLSLRDNSLVFEPFESDSQSQSPAGNLCFEKKLQDIPQITFSKRLVKDSNVTIPFGCLHINEPKNLIFMGLERPMEYLYCSLQECRSRVGTLQNVGNSSFFTPKLLEKSSIFRPNDLKLLSFCMPRRFQNCNWSLLYSTNDHGISIHTFYSRVSEKSPTLMLIKNTDGDCFGCYASQAWKPNLHYYGTGECFVFTLFPEYHVYGWSLENHSFQLSTMEFLAIGGGKHFAIWIDSDFVNGTSGECDTFHSPSLCSHEEFTCHILEVWYPVPSY